MGKTAEVVDGRRIALDMQLAVKEKIGRVVTSSGRAPKLVSIIVGHDKEARLYARVQERTAENVGIDYELLELAESTSQGEILELVARLDGDQAVTSVIVQHPLPDGMDHTKIITSIKPEKDAEGIHPYNLGRIYRRDADIVPCTPGAIMKILSVKGIDLYGKDVVIIGHSAIVGKPLSLMMLNETATTAVCHVGTRDKGNITEYTKKADVLVVAVGKPEMVKADWIKEGAVVIDVGINTSSGRLVGDVDFSGVSAVASLITPVPGGVGPVTVSILMRNVLRAYLIQNGKGKALSRA